jgi:hypothetical protein
MYYINYFKLLTYALIFITQPLLHSTATSSLLFHVDQLISPAENEIRFTEKNISSLWINAENETSPEHQELYISAKDAYYQTDLAAARTALVELWNKQRDFEIDEKDVFVDYNGFLSNPRLSLETKKRITPFILPTTHPLKTAMDTIFLASRVTLNLDTLVEAGFTPLFIQPRSFVIVCMHALLRKHLIKANLDSELRFKNDKPEWEWLTRRCEGAKRIRRVIKKENMKYFAIPNKWLYPLPETPAPPDDKNYRRKEFVLLCEDMDLVSSERNKIAWKTVITKKHLRELYKIISYAWPSSFRRENIPYSRSGKFTFIDTEYRNPDKKPHYESIRISLSKEMDLFWELLIATGGYG